MNNHRIAWQTPVATLLVILVATLFVYPFVWMFFASFKENREIYQPMVLLPKQFDGQYFGQLFGGRWFPFFTVFTNSLLIALAQASGAVYVTAAAGFVFARHRFRLHGLLFFLAVAGVLVPRQVIALPLVSWLMDLRLHNSLAGVILPGLVSGLGILFFTQTFRRLPNSMLEAARMEGASEYRIFRLLLPLVTPALLTYGLVHFVLAWHEHLIPLLVLQADELRTLPLSMSSLYSSSMRFPRAVIMAGSVMTLFPAAILFALFYRQFRSALSDALSMK